MKLPMIPIAPPSEIEVHHHCSRCMALCCHAVSTEIDVPTTPKDFDNLRWFLMHPGVRVYADSDGAWYLMYESTCKFLGDDNLCTIYEKRPQMCRDLSPDDCEFAMGPEDRHYFTCIEEFDQWLEERSRKGNRRSSRNGKSQSAPG